MRPPVRDASPKRDASHASAKRRGPAGVNRVVLMRFVLWSSLVISQFAVPARGAELKRLDAIETVVNDAIQRRDIPGAVVAVLHRGDVVYRKAFGNRALKPAEEPMT